MLSILVLLRGTDVVWTAQFSDTRFNARHAGSPRMIGPVVSATKNDVSFHSLALYLHLSFSTPSWGMIVPLYAVSIVFVGRNASGEMFICLNTLVGRMFP